ncbi:L,D-transpeptidase family protein [Bradyrhizobium sp.]|uniref:L,D-transpeptidase n=1 Tax=Bradyrhizobium sp. TaxID=376 RepID=UPI003C415E86
MRGHAAILAAALAWFVGIEGAEAKLDILVDKATQRMMVIQNGYVRYMWPVSTGRDEMATPNGVYTPQRMERNWFSRAYYNSPMPYAIFFHNGYAIHGSYAIDKLGGPASHGCVRLHPHHAELLFDLVQQEGPDQTTIEVTDDARPDAPPLPGREAAPQQNLSEPPPRVVRYQDTGDMPELAPIPHASRPIAVRPQPDDARPDAPPLPGREVAAERSLPLPPPRLIRHRDTGDMTEFERIPRAYRPIAVRPQMDDPRPDAPPFPGREVAAERGLSPPPPRVIRYRDIGDIPEFAPIQRAYRPIAMRPPPPVSRRVLADVRPPANIPLANNPPARIPAANVPPANVTSANVPRAPCGAGEIDPGRGTPRQTDEASDCRPRPKVAEAAPPEHAQPGRSFYGFKLLPASCWSGSASRWRSGGSSEAACK